MKGKRTRDDFCWVRPLEQYGSVTVRAGNLHIVCTREAAVEVTRAEWEHLLKHRGSLEICEAPHNGER